MGAARRIILQQAGPKVRLDAHIGIAQQRGQVVNRGPIPHALEINHPRPALAQQHVAGLKIAVDQHPGRAIQGRPHRGQFTLDDGRGLDTFTGQVGGTFDFRLQRGQPGQRFP